MQITKFIPAPKAEVFDAFISPQKLEQWHFSEGFSVKVPKFEARKDGRYEYISKGPDGNTLLENIQGFISFRDHGSGTEVVVRQHGFKSNKEDLQCEQNWADGLSNLTSMLHN